MMNNNRNKAEKAWSDDVAMIRALTSILAGYIAISFVILMAANYLIPAPLAEFMAFCFYFAKGEGGSIPLAVLFGIIPFLTAALCILIAFLEKGKKLPLRIAASLPLAADIVIHVYAFIKTNGYQWNYLFSAILDTALLVCALRGISKELKRGGAEKAENEEIVGGAK